MQTPSLLRPPTISELKLTSINVDYQLGQVIVFSRVLCDLGLTKFTYHRKTVNPTRGLVSVVERLKRVLGLACRRFCDDKTCIEAFKGYCGFGEREKEVLRVVFDAFTSKEALMRRQIGVDSKFDLVVDEFLGVYERIKGVSETFGCLRRVYTAFGGAERVIGDLETFSSECTSCSFEVWDKCRYLKMGEIPDGFDVNAYLDGVLENLKCEDIHTMTFLQERASSFVGEKPVELKTRVLFGDEVVDRFESKYGWELPETIDCLSGFFNGFYNAKTLEKILVDSGVKTREDNVSRKNYELRLEMQKIARAEQKIRVLEMVLSGVNIHNRARNEASLKKVRETLAKAQKKVDSLTKKGAFCSERIDDQSCYLSFSAYTTSYKLCQAVIKLIKDAMEKSHDASHYSYDFIPGVNERCSRFIVSFPKNSKLYGVMKCKGEGFLKSLLSIVRDEIEKAHGNRLRFCKLVPLEKF